MMHRILLVNGALTTVGLLADFAGVAALNSLEVALFGVCCGIFDTVTFLIINRRKGN